MFVLLDQVLHITHGESWLARIPGAYALLAAFGSLGMVVIARLVSAIFRRKENYYTTVNSDD